ncbi:hypothetical protein TNIN_310731 [Trichonephila inaurata madagascariensis]|uniref:Uncharacterized protein n=1 Tax=Trichonephila inaurata madagascariensis TaxID=2747483 RepID=A0A8X6YY93_9ARAC|nr:hypothetical protein TNIN_310731 [Trichonephila inaurata madagascariensis]
MLIEAKNPIQTQLQQIRDGNCILILIPLTRRICTFMHSQKAQVGMLGKTFSRSARNDIMRHPTQIPKTTALRLFLWKEYYVNMEKNISEKMMGPVIQSDGSQDMQNVW